MNLLDLIDGIPPLDPKDEHRARVLYEGPTTPYTPFVRGSETSEAAAEAMPSERANTIRRTIERAIIEAEALGCTDDELQVGLNLEGSTQRPRRIELVQQHRIIDSGRTRPTRSGRKAVVWVAAKYAETSAE